MPNTEVVLDELPMCNFRHDTAEPAHYDGATVQGSWAYMCEEHFKMYGLGLGLGRGQRLVVRNGR
jgi:hypothetical protein